MRKKFNNVDYVDMGEACEVVDVGREALAKRIKKYNDSRPEKEQIKRLRDGQHVYIQFKFLEKLAEPTALAPLVSSSSTKKKG